MALQTKQSLCHIHKSHTKCLSNCLSLHYGFMSYLQPNNCPLPQLFSLYSQLLNLADKLGHLRILNILKRILQVAPLTSVQRRACLATLSCCREKTYSDCAVTNLVVQGSTNSQVLLPSSEQLFHAVLASHTCTALTQSTRGTGFMVQVSILSQHLSQPEASPSLWPRIPMLCQQLALILAQCAHGDPVQGAQSVIPSHFQAVLGTVLVPAQEKQQENAAQRVRNRIVPFTGPLIRLV